MYPSPSSFVSSEPGSAWWIARVGGDVAVCSTTGASFVRVLQQAIGVSQDGIWSEGTSRALSVALLARSAPAAMVASVNREAAAHTIGPESLAAAIWLLHRNARGPVPGNLTSDDLRLPSNVQAPVWGHASPSASGNENGPLVCSALTSPNSQRVPWSQVNELVVPAGIDLTKAQTGSSAPWPLILTIGGIAVGAVLISVWLTPRRNPAHSRARQTR